jgi:hypothetical protein
VENGRSSRTYEAGKKAPREEKFTFQLHSVINEEEKGLQDEHSVSEYLLEEDS